MFDQGEKINSKYRREQYSTLEHGENNLLPHPLILIAKVSSPNIKCSCLSQLPGEKAALPPHLLSLQHRHFSYMLQAKTI